MEYLTVKQMAELAGCTERRIKQKAQNGDFIVNEIKNDRNLKQYLFPVDTLPESIKNRYYAMMKSDMNVLSVASAKAIDTLTEKEREQIRMWSDIVLEWQRARANYNNKTDADELFVSKLKLEKGPMFAVSVDTLYRKWRAYKNGDLLGLLDKRGGANKGKSSIPQEVWDYFLSVYLDERKLPLKQCYELAIEYAKSECPEDVPNIPCCVTFRRRVEKEIPRAVIVAGREGNKECRDTIEPYIQRDYSDLLPNDYWIADNHTLDIISQDENGVTHRLYLTAFADARSGVITGINITDSPNSQSTVIALRDGILKFGIPKNVYFDNGSEFLTHDLAGRGHRTRKSQLDVKNPPPVFARLGINMTNAIVCNARAKNIERYFRTIKEDISRLFMTFCGGNVLERPENLKHTIKKGQIPADATVKEYLRTLIDGVYNVGEYGGAVTSDRGKKRIDVWKEYIEEIRKPQNEEDLNLMLMRSTRAQKVKRNGVCLNIAGEKLEYFDIDTWRLFGKEVYLRYDPDDLSSVRIYDADTDAYIKTLPLSTETRVKFNADNKEDIAIGQAKIRKVHKAIKKDLNEYKSRLSPEKRIDMLDMQIRRAYQGKENLVIKEPAVVVPVISGESNEQLKAVGENVTPVIIDINRMNKNAAARKK